MQDLDTGEWVALKVQKSNARNFNKSDVKAESNTLEEMGRRLGKTKRKSRKDSKITHYHIVMPLGKGITLADFLKNAPQDLQPEDWLLIAYRILEAYKLQIADNNLVHRDIKPANILIDPLTFEITFIDLGLAKPIGTDKPKYCGSPSYIPPEVFAHQKLQTSHDIYTLGRLLLYIFDYIEEDKSKNRRDFCLEAKRLKRGERTDPAGKCWKETNRSRIDNADIDGALKPFLDSMVAFEPNSRPSLDQALDFIKEKVSEQNQNFSNEKKIGFLNLTEYEKLPEEQQREKEAELQNMDLVYFIDPQKRDLKEYLGLKGQLEALKIKIADRVYQSKEQVDNPAERKNRFSNHNHPITLDENTIRDAIMALYGRSLTKNPMHRNDQRVLAQSQPLGILSEYIFKWVKNSNSSFLKMDMSRNLDSVLQEVIGERFLNSTSLSVTESLESYKANFSTIRQLALECENYITMSEVDKDKKNTVTELRKKLDTQQRTETTKKILENFGTEFEKKKPALEKVRDPITTGFIGKIHKLLHIVAYHGLSFFFKPKGRQLAEKIEERLIDSGMPLKRP